MFKRRRQRSYVEMAGDAVYPRGGWGRALRYMAYRLRRLPDPDYKIARGISAGVFTSFTPFFGLHFLIAAGVAWMLRGNILAALLATFVGNPLTFPIIAGLSVELGSRLLGVDHPIPLSQTVGAFSQVSVELWENTRSIFTPEVMHWGRFADFMGRVFLPYLVGGIGPGILAGVLAYIVSRPVIGAYQKARAAAHRKRLDKLRADRHALFDPAPFDPPPFDRAAFDSDDTEDATPPRGSVGPATTTLRRSRRRGPA